VNAIRVLEERIAARPDNAKAHYQLAVLLLATRDLYKFYAPDTTGVLKRAARLLERAVELDPRHAPSHAALGFTYHQRGKQLDRALVAFKTARRLDPKNATVDVYVPTILVEMEREAEALAEITRVARRRKESLAKVRKEYAKAGLPRPNAEELLGVFIHARNYLWSEVTDKAEAIRNSAERGRKQRIEQGWLDDCTARQRQLTRGFRRARVPAALRPLAAAAARYGIGDDVCRPFLMGRIPKKERVRLIARGDALASKVDAWLDSFGHDMSVEAAAFMYLMNGIDEVR
jgi:tetratricopeptide (TPR) repeat protein